MRRHLFLVALAGLLSLGRAQAEPNVRDTRLLSQPAVSARNIAFIYADDLWIANLDGSNPRRLTTHQGSEGNPVFSPDGQTIAFSAEYDGNMDVFTIPITGGTPTRLTTHPDPDVVRGFTPDGKSILFASPRNVYSRRHAQLFTVPLTGGMPTQLPIPWGFEASYSPDGDYIAYTPVRDATAQWKNYRGGTHSRIWIYRVKDHQVEAIPQPESRCNDLDPQWLGKAIAFRSDRNGEYNLFTYDTTSKTTRQLTNHTDFPVLDINVGAGKLVYEQAGYLHLYDAERGSPSRLRVGVSTDLVEARSRFAKGSKYVRGAAVSPSGARAAFEFRGEIVTVPAEKGDPRNLTNSVSAHDRDPAWSPDGKTIAYFSDTAGEYQLCLTPQDGKGATRRLKVSGAGFYQNLVWSRDSKKVLFTDNASALYWLDVTSGTQTKIAQPPYGLSRGVKLSNWSPDSQWVAYAINNNAQISQVFVYSLASKTSSPVTDGLSEAVEPVFDASGKYLYFLGSDDTGMSKHAFALSASDSRPPRWSIHLAVLRKNLPSPFLRESDEEKGEPTKPVIATKPGEDGKVVLTEEARLKMREALDAAKKPAADKAAPFTIDLAGLDQRILSFPLPPSNYANLQAGAAGQVYYLTRPEASMGGRGPGGPMGGSLSRYDLDRKKAETVQASVMTYELTPDGRKMLYASSPTTWVIGSTGGGAPSGVPAGLSALMGAARSGGAPSASDAAPTGRLNLDSVEVKIDPQAEWKQIFHEAWRINRDYFYAPNMHGANWPAIEKKYEAFLPHLTSSGDLYRVIRWMLSELAVGHSYITAYGERLYDKKTVPGGLLGADFEEANGRYRFKKIYGGLNWTADLRSPLTAPGVNVKEGEYLLAVNGTDLKAPAEVYALFENTAGKNVDLTVGPTPDGMGSRTVTVQPLESEVALRNREWIEGNLRKVHKATGGRVGYVYLPDTAGMGVAYFKRYFFPQVDKEALIIDERFNGGGQIADYYIDILRRPPICHWAPRHGADWRFPSAAVHGPKVMLIDEGAGSGGDMLPWMFRKFQVGPLVGKRTWGGLVGIGGYPVLMDGGRVTAPSLAIWNEDGFIVENEGVPPDYDVEQWPADVIAGKDPQLEKAIELVLKELEKNPPKKPQRPDFPVRARP